MRFSWMLPACAAAFGALSVGNASAQGQSEDPAQYPAQEATPLDKNYGLPTFGMPGMELPQQKTTPEKVTPPQSSLFQDPTEITLPKARPAPPGGTDYDTPLFTTSQGSTTGDTTASSSDTTSSAGDTTSFDDDARR